MDDAQGTIQERANSHGDYADVARTSQAIKQVIRNAVGDQPHNVITPAQQESMELIAMKLARIIHGNRNEVDHWRDIAGYATLITNKLTTGNHA